MSDTQLRDRTAGDSAARTDTEHEHTTEDESEELVCPECGGNVVADESRGETVCADCGLVIDEDSIDRGPEWRAFDSAERDQKSRVGAPTTNLMHDKGLSTNIGWQNKDAYGNALSSRQREQMQRLRTWNERFRTRDSKERNLKQALGEIDRMASALGLPENVRETASVIYRRALDEIERVSRVDKMELTRTYRYVVRELKLEVEPADPAQYVPRFASDLDLSDEAERRARELLESAKRAAIHSGKSPVGLAAAAVYAAALLTNEKVTQNQVSEVADVSEVTIRNRYKELLEASDAGMAA